MVKKKDKEGSDLTRIEDLSEFLHQEDSDLDSMFESLSSPSKKPDPHETSSTGIDFSETLVDSPEEEITFEATSLDDVSLGDPLPESLEEFQTGDLFEKTSFGENPFQNDSGDEDTSFDLPDVEFGSDTNEATSMREDFREDTQKSIHESIQEDTQEEEEISLPKTRELHTHTSEKFEDVKTFAQNFSYGTASLGGGNPPYTIIARHIKYAEDAENILDLLKEFGIVNEQNARDTEKALEFGSLIIPQISEYTAIVLAHKMRRFDLDLEVGLSDEVHPSKSGGENPRGLIKKENLRQNRSETLKISDLETPIKDIIVSTTASLPGYAVESYLGVQTTFSIIEESELEKLQYIEKAQREHTELFEYNSEELTSDKAFKDYRNSFAMIYTDLTMQLKQKAFAQNANALLGLSFQLSPMHFERSHNRVTAYQITCSATLAIVGKEKV